MKARYRQSGLSLMEMAVIIATIALLVGIGLPAVRALIKSFETEGGAKGVISAALSSSRTIAVKNQKYAGIRFQNRNQANGKGAQYMTFIIQDPNLYGPVYKAAYGFRAIQGIKPVKLPETVGVIGYIERVDEIDTAGELEDKITFSVVFSPAGKLVIHDVQVLRQGSNDSVFNESGSGAMFTDDYYTGTELSQNRFIIYDKNHFDGLDAAGKFDYLDSLEIIYINSYTGAMIPKD